MHIHRNTLRYRLDRICEIAQLNMKDEQLKKQIEELNREIDETVKPEIRQECVAADHTSENTADEEEQLNEEDAANPHAKAHNMHLRVENAYITGRTLREVSEFLNRDIVCSRLLHNGEVSIPNSKTMFEVGVELRGVCA